MDVIGFLCISLDSSTVQLHDSPGSGCACTSSEAGFSGQNGDRTRQCISKEQHSVVRFFLWAKGPNAKDIHKEMFPVYSGKCLSRKEVHNRVEKFSQGCSKFAVDARPDAEVAETTAKRLLWCGFRSTGKAMGQVYQCLVEGMSRNKCFFQVRISPVLRFISICDLFTDSTS
jgi:hypothetical protein